jgi:hypothetical protein
MFINRKNKLSGNTKNFSSKILLKFFSLKISFRPHNLKERDYLRSKEIIKKGDLILVGDFKSISGLFIGKYFTHSLLYIGRGACIHAGPKGVSKILFKEIFKKYDTCMILRPNICLAYDDVVEKAIRFAKKQVGKPYDIFFEADNSSYFCTDLINDSFFQAGFDTGVRNKEVNKKGLINVFGRIKKAARADHFLRANFSKVFISRDIENSKNIFSFSKFFKKQLHKI